jgi:hypothetical protein
MKDWWIKFARFQSGLKGADSTQGEGRNILSGSRPEGRGSCYHLVSEPRIISFLSVAERREKILQPCTREEETGKYLIQQWKEKCREEETGK